MFQFDLLSSPPGNPRATPGTSPALRVRGWVILKRSCPGGEGGGANKKYLLFDFAKYVLFLARFTRWLRTSRLRILRENAGICRRVVGEADNLSKLKSVFKSMFSNIKRMSV